MSETAENSSLYWICEECGNEVEFEGNFENMICPSCLTPASDREINKIKTEIERRRKEKERIEKEKKRIALQQYQAQLRAKREALAAKSVHGISILYTIIIIAGLVLTLVSAFSQHQDVAKIWENMSSVAVKGSSLYNFGVSLGSFLERNVNALVSSGGMLKDNLGMIWSALVIKLGNIGTNLPYLLNNLGVIIGNLGENLKEFLSEGSNNLLHFGESILHMIER